MAGRHSRLVPGGRAYWHAERLWTLAKGLPVRHVPIAGIAEFDQNCRFGPDTPPTCKAVADLAHPVILAADGGLMDGGHRIAKAWLLGHTTIATVRFVSDPEPDYVVGDGA